MKGLIIDEPWIRLILRGEKTWEMRKTACSHRGPIALIRKGSGTVVGVAEVVESLPAIETRAEYDAAEPRHRIPAGRQEQAFTDGWRTPWVLAHARALPRPVPYRHPFGAVIWVNLEPEVARQINAQIGGAPPAAAPPSVPSREEDERSVVADSAARPPAAALPRVQTARADFGQRVETRLRGGNIRNNHINLGSVLHFFPADAMGGSNRHQVASRQLDITFQPGGTMSTDIDATKKILRARGAVADFFARSGAEEGDIVVIERTAPYAFTFSLRRAV